MLNEYLLSTPRPTDYFSQIFANLREIKSLFDERYTLDHEIPATISESYHNTATMCGLEVNTSIDNSPYRMNDLTGQAELPANCVVVFVRKDSDKLRLCYTGKNLNVDVFESVLRESEDE
jgi:hypothetical protein